MAHVFGGRRSIPGRLGALRPHLGPRRGRTGISPRPHPRLPWLGAALLLLGAPIVAGGCTAPAATVEIAVRYSRFVPDAITVPAGRPIQFVLSSEDPIDHEWIVGDEGVHQRHRTGTEPSHGARPTEQSLPALGTVRTTVTFDRPGTYLFICHLPGHEDYGMTGTVTVTGG